MVNKQLANNNIQYLFIIHHSPFTIHH